MPIFPNFMTGAAKIRKVDVNLMHNKMPKTLARYLAAFLSYYGFSGGVIFTPPAMRGLSTNTFTSAMHYAVTQVALGIERDEGCDATLARKTNALFFSGRLNREA